MFIAALLAVAKKCKQPMCPLMDQWTNRMWFIHTVVYYFAFKNHEILTRSTTGMNPEEVMLSKVSQTQPGKHYVTPLTGGV